MSRIDAAMNICHLLTSRTTIGGVEKHVIELSHAQAALGHVVSVIADPMFAAHFGGDVRLVAHRMSHGRFNLPGLLGLRRKIVTLQPDVLHAHGNRAATMLGVLRRTGLRLPLVGTVHGINRDNRCFHRCHAVIAVSRYAGESLGGKPYTVIWNSIAPPSIDARAMMTIRDGRPPFIGEGRPILCTVGRLISIKGIDVLLRALAGMEDVCLWIVGDGHERRHLENLADQLGVADRVWFAGHRSDATALMIQADLVVIASHHEGGPYVLTEALCSGVCVVSTQVGFAPEVLPACALVPPGNVQALSERLKFALSHSAVFRNELTAAFRLAERELTLEAMAHKVIAVYAEAKGMPR